MAPLQGKGKEKGVETSSLRLSLFNMARLQTRAGLTRESTRALPDIQALIERYAGLLARRVEPKHRSLPMTSKPSSGRNLDMRQHHARPARLQQRIKLARPRPHRAAGAGARSQIEGLRLCKRPAFIALSPHF